PAQLSSYAPQLGRSLCQLGRHDEAEPLARLGRELGDEHDVLTQILWREVLALVLAHRGEHARAESFGREAVTIAPSPDTLNTHGAALCDLGEVLVDAGRPEEASEKLRMARSLYAQKKNVVMAEQVRMRLSELATS